MERTATDTAAVGRVRAERILLAGVLSAIFSAIANALLFVTASSFFGGVVITSDEPVTFGQVVGASVAGAVGAVVVFAVIDRFTRRPIRVFRGVAAFGLLLSFIPIALAAPRDRPRGRWPSCTWWTRRPTSACSRSWAGRSKGC